MSAKARLKAITRQYAEKAREAASYFDYAFAIADDLDEAEAAKVLSDMQAMGVQFPDISPSPDAN